MSYGAYKTSKTCLACANWGGPRKVGACNRAETDSMDTKGKCYIGRGVSPSAANASYGCSSFEPWAALK